MRKRVKITLPFALITDREVSANAVRVYAVLKSFAGKPHKEVRQNAAVTHRQIIELSGLSDNTVKKSLKQLEQTNWIIKQTNSGAANLYILTDIIFEEAFLKRSFSLIFNFPTAHCHQLADHFI